MPKSSSQLKNMEGHNILQSVHDYNEEVSFIVCGRQLLTVDLCGKVTMLKVFQLRTGKGMLIVTPVNK